MAIDTTLAGVAPWINRPSGELTGTTNFLRAFEAAQEQKSPLYLAQVQQAQAQIQNMGFQLQRNQLGLEMDRAAQADMVAGKQSAAEIATAMSKIKDWSNPSALSTIDALYSKRPSKEGKAMVDEAATRHKEAVAAKDRSEQNRLRAEATAARMETELYKAGTKQETDLVKAQAGIDVATAKLEAAKNKLSPQAAEREDLANLTEQKSALETLAKSNPGRPDLTKMLREVNTKIEAWKVQHQATEETVEATPGGGMILRRGPAKAAPTPETLTTQNLSKAQDSINQSVMTIEAADRLLPLISSETVGPRAFAESWIKDRLLANLYPDLASEKRVTAERFAAELRSTTIRELRSDGNISEKERTQILSAVPEINDPIDSPQRAKDLIKATRKTAAIRAVVTARRMGGQTPKAAAKALEDTDLLRMADTGLITKQEAQSIWKLKRQP